MNEKGKQRGISKKERKQERMLQKTEKKGGGLREVNKGGKAGCLERQLGE